jgi:hypothetical protein
MRKMAESMFGYGEIKPATAIHSTAFFNKKNSIFYYEK